MNLQEARGKYCRLRNAARGSLARSDEQDILDILSSSENKEEVIEALKQKIETIYPVDVWRRVKFQVALNDLKGE